MKKVLCLVGESGAGKSTVATHLATHYQWAHTSLSDRVRQYAADAGYPSPRRDQLEYLANEARKTYGTGYFASQVVSSEVFQKSNAIVVEGIRNPAELEEIKRSIGDTAMLVVCAVISTQQTRYQRILIRNHSSDPTDYQTFLRNDRRELASPEGEHGQQAEKLITMADVRLENNGTIHDLTSQLTKMMQETGLSDESNIENDWRRRKE